MLGFLS